jgi:hypothetical protein
VADALVAACGVGWSTPACSRTQVYLECGVLLMEPGAGGSSIFAMPLPPDRPARWRTARERQAAQFVAPPICHRYLAPAQAFQLALDPAPGPC